MTQYGKITHYDAQTGAGMIKSERGGDPLPFDRAGLQQQGQEPRSDQIYAFETRNDDSGRVMAVNLQMEEGPNARQQSPDDNGNQGGFDQFGQSQNRANQDAASRPPVDAQNDGYNDANDGASAYQPLRTDAGRSADQYRGEQASGQVAGHEGVSRAGVETQDAGVFRGSQSSHEGSTFQPLEAGRDDGRGHDKQRGNPPGQNQQGLNQPAPNDRGRNADDQQISGTPRSDGRP